ncbi:MAG: peroxiredoxin family protein [Eubacteriales bacterium]
MKKIKIPTKKALSFLLAMLMLLGACLTACQGGTGDNTTGGDINTGAPEGTTGIGGDTTKGEDGAKLPYNVEVVSAGGLKLKDVTVLIYSDSTLSVMNGYSKTDENGVAGFSLPAEGTSYHAVLSGIPDGYDLADSYPLTGTDTTITLTSEVIADESLSGVQYKLGDIMHDFTVTTTDGETLKLSELLKTKKAVLINFWYINCSWCQKEFPYMDSVYREYKDDIAIVAVNPSSDSFEDIKAYRASNDYAIPMAKVDTSLATAFNVQYYPTSVIVDRYGMISVIEKGAITYEEPFVESFNHFKSENYVQRLEESMKAFVEVNLPTVDMPESSKIEEAINGANGNGITYRAETDEEFKDTIWDFDLVEKNGVKCLVNTNQGANGTTALLYVDVELKAGQAVKFDYFASSELGADVLFIIVDNVRIYQISGESEKWETCYPYVAIKDGKYTIAIAYIKDSSDSVGDDSVYLTNFEICPVADIASPSFIPRNCATDRNADGYGYANYANVVFNENDGYYHVGTADGPLLLANLMGYNSPFAESSVHDLVYSNDAALYEEMVSYFSYASNATISGVCTVNKELKELLEKVALAYGIEVENDKQWLQMCVYYDVYGAEGQLDDPIKGLAPHSAYIAEMGKDNIYTYDRLIMPRGFLYKFVPEQSGAYRISAKCDELLDSWIFDENMDIYYDSDKDGGERLYFMQSEIVNCPMTVYFEAGKSYYIDICYYDMYFVGTFTFEIEYIGERYDHFTIASPGVFTFIENENGAVIGETIAGGIDVILGEDGYYHELRKDGSIGSVIYADFVMATPIFDKSLTTMANMNAFNFTFTENDLFIRSYMAIYGDDYKNKLKEAWGDQYEEYYELYKVDEVAAGIFHGKGEDLTELFKEYAKLAVEDAEHPERSGCVPVDARLAQMLQQLMDKYTFEDVDHSWTKVCYYYRYIGAPVNP